MDAPELSVYGEAKSEYTRQLCVFLIPSLESYFLDLLETAKTQASTPSKALWQFQSLLQGIPDWNQDKVLRETEIIQKDCKCDYLEELLTAVFIAHTKVLSAIRLTTKQKKLQLTIPKLDHFLHRVLSDCARSLWTNAYLFADTNSIEKQKNLRQVASLLQEGVLQAIRGMLPVKSILREYLHEDDDDEKEDTKKVVEEFKSNVNEEETKPVEEETKPVEEETKPVEEETKPVEEETKPVEEETTPLTQDIKVQEEIRTITSSSSVKDGSSNMVINKMDDFVGVAPEEEKDNSQPPIINIDTTKSTVSFTNHHVFFDSDNLDENEIHDIPFAEAELKNDEDEDDEEDEIDSIKIMDEILPMDAEELDM
jgi:hypothetical protein